MAFDKSGGFIITTDKRHIGKTGVTLGNLTEIARILLGKKPGEPGLRRVFGELQL